MERMTSPFSMMHIQVADMISNTDTQLHNLEKEFSYMESLQPSKRKPGYWNNLGSSKNRTKEQEVMSRGIIEEKMRRWNRLYSSLHGWFVHGKSWTLWVRCLYVLDWFSHPIPM